MKEKKENILMADIAENKILELNPTILSILLIDRTSKENIIWATNNYTAKGIEYNENKPIKIELITGKNGNTIKPRVKKNKSEKQARSREKAEVFTPSWVCNVQNNLIDEAWFGYKNVFNKEVINNWETCYGKIEFPKNKSWQDYIMDTRLEISCGEAPYIVSRYDSVTGDIIPIEDRIGLLDRKLRIVSENTSTKEEWINWAEKAFKNVYGYDWQGDNVLLARENLLYTLIEYYEKQFNEKIEEKILVKFAEIISWNVWQMDGLKFVIPNSCSNEEETQVSLFKEEKKTSRKCIGCEKNMVNKHNGKKCIIMDWEKNKKIKYVSLIGG